MKTVITIAFLLTVLACKEARKQTISNEASFVAIDDLKYSAYSWYYPGGEWEFYLDYYVHVDKSGHFELMLRDSVMSELRYYKGIIGDTLRNSIDKTFLVDTFKADYKTAELQNIAYDGFTYYLDIEKDSSSKKIMFIRYRCPVGLESLSTLLDNIINTTNSTKVDTIDITQYSEELKKLSSASLGPPPKVVAPNKWKPVKISK